MTRREKRDTDLNIFWKVAKRMTKVVDGKEGVNELTAGDVPKRWEVNYEDFVNV